MNKKLGGALLLSLGLLSSGVAMANDAVIGALLGGGAGAMVGHSLGGRDGTIIGGALGAAAGAAIASESRPARVVQRVDYYPPPPAYYVEKAHYEPVRIYRPGYTTVYYVRDGYDRGRRHHRHRDNEYHRGWNGHR